MPRLEKWQIEEIVSNVNIVDIVAMDVDFDRKKSKPGVGDYFFCCPFHGEKNPSAHVDQRRQRYKCFACGEGGDALRWLIKYRNLSFPEAIKALGGELNASGLTEEEKERRKREQRAAQKKREEAAAAQNREKSQTAKSIWSECRPSAGTLAEQYMIGRGIPKMDWPPTVRFHPSLFHEFERGKTFPALVMAVQAKDRQLIGLWRIYLDPKTAGKADIEQQKLGFGPTSGGAIRLGPVGKNLAVCEGGETGFGVMNLIQLRMPVWALMSTSGMIGFDIPDETENLFIYRDGDRYRFHKKTGEVTEPPGKYAAEKLKERAEDISKRGIIHSPPNDGSDWLDVWNGVKEQYENS